MYNCLFYTDSGPSIGLGHLIRAISLGEELQNHNFNIKYITQDIEKSKQILKQKNYDFKIDDFKNFDVLKKEKPSVIITDLFNPSYDFLSSLKKYCNLLVSVDDFSRSQYCSDIIFNTNFHCKKENYNKNLKVFHGLKYFITQKKAYEYHLKNKKINEVANKILISFGGNDINNSTMKVIYDLYDIEDIEIISSYKTYQNHRKEIQLKPNIKIYNFISDMPKIMYDSDIIFCGGGLTLYQSACIGTPIIVIPQVEHEIESSIEFEKKNITINLGIGKNVLYGDIRNTYLAIREDKNRRNKMSINGKKEIDGEGAKRIVKLIVDEL